MREDQLPLYDRLANLIASKVIAALKPWEEAMDAKLTALITETQRTAALQTKQVADNTAALQDLETALDNNDDDAIDAATAALKTSNDAMQASSTTLESALASLSSAAGAPSASGSSSTVSGASGSSSTLGQDTTGAVGNQGQTGTDSVAGPSPGDTIVDPVPGNLASGGAAGAGSVPGSGT